MTVSIAALQQQVQRQRELAPALYADMDFDQLPERWTETPGDDSHLAPGLTGRRNQLLADPERVALMRAYTLLGDAVCDAYVALMPRLGFKTLVALLVQACERGVDQVAEAPPELVALLRDMERVPDWLDMDLVERGARIERNGAAHLGPVIMRGAFLATFLNKYAALPMVLTGRLSTQRAAHRVKETASFFTLSVMPGALRRDGAGFKAAAMVRLMHSMVRFNALRSGAWDRRVYGIPIPQVDQMPAGLIAIYLMASRVLKSGRSTFTPDERARVELARYRAYLLGLPEALLADTPRAIVDLWLTRAATLRKGFDDATCGELIRSTMAAYLPADRRWTSRLRQRLEQGFSKAFFVRAFLYGDRERAARIGVQVGAADRLCALLVLAGVASRMLAFGLAARVPGLADWADRRLVAKLRRRLQGLGQAEFTTDAPPPGHGGGAGRPSAA
ncbi:MAG: DUF2236 domain-containing protein [Burkholderiaceae bacterium]|nr:DUF2236 domain-containing protein [Burkholderiaceae bacterium]